MSKFKEFFGKVSPSQETKDTLKDNAVKGAKIAGIWLGYCALIVVSVLTVGYAVDRGGEKLGLNKPLEIKQV